jgi:dUTP pyrophosphatase
MTVDLKIFSISGATLSYANKGDAGLDITATNLFYDAEKNLFVYGTDLKLEIPEGYVGIIFPRSSISKYDLSLANSVGVIDSSFRGEVILKFRPTIPFGKVYEVGEKIGQLILFKYPTVNVIQVNSESDLSLTDRGDGGFGSTGK